MKQWDKIFEKEGRVFLKPQEDVPRIVKLLRKNKVKKVLDLGCGSGRHTVYLAKNGFEVYGIDIAPVGIKLTKDWLKQENLRANLKLGSIYRKLPYEDNFFDALIAVQVINHGKIESIRRLIKEMERILRPGGFIFVTTSRMGSIKNIPKEKLWKIKFIAPRTFIPLSHDEKGLVHYWFTKQLLRKEFKNFKIHDIKVSSNRRHYCLLAELKK